MEAAKIEAIKNYLSFYDVKYYDVQTELIDHFASAVEKLQREDPNLTFKLALLEAHRNFGGRKGIWKYLDTIKGQVRKKTTSMLLKLLVEFLYWPYILLTVMVVIFWHLLFINVSVDYDFLYFIVIIVGATLVWVVNSYKLKNVPMYLPRQANRSWGLIFCFALLLPGNHLVLFNEQPTHTLVVAYFSLVCFIYISFLRLPGLAIKETLKIYPQIASTY